MRITEIVVKIEPSQGDDLAQVETRILHRTADRKKWFVNGEGGFFPHEIALIQKVQELIADFNLVDPRNKQ